MEPHLKKIKIHNNVYYIASDDEYLEAVGIEFEPHMVELFLSLVHPDDIVADIGANIGLTSILFSKIAKSTYAFEPSPTTCSILSNNLTRNKISNVHALNLGLGHQQEKLTICFASNNRSGGFVNDKINLEAGHVTEDVYIETIDDYFEKTEISASFLKIDVEGFEMNVIRGARNFLKNNRPTVVMEMNHFCLNVLQRVTLPEFLDFMRTVFPYLYAVDYDNLNFADLHNPDEAYGVMHAHVVNQRFPNIVGGFDCTLVDKISNLVETTNSAKGNGIIARPKITNPIGNIDNLSVFSSLSAGTSNELQVSVANKSDERWFANGDHPVFLSYHWKDNNGNICIYDGVRTTLLYSEIEPGMVYEQNMNVIAPSEVGTYLLCLTLVQEGICWFEDHGFNQCEIQVDII